MNIKIEKRVPFGFKGKWGKCYKNSIFDVEYHDSIIYQDDTYYDIGSDVQFKYLEDGVDKSVMNSQAVKNMVADGKFRLVKTTDAMFNNDTLEYECVVQQNDIVYVFGSYWICEKVDERSVFSPAKQTFYYLSLKNVQDEVVGNFEKEITEELCATFYFSNTSGQVMIYLPSLIGMTQNTINLVVDWGDGNIETFANALGGVSHTYESENNYIVKVFSNSKFAVSFSNTQIIRADFVKNILQCRFYNTKIMQVDFTGVKQIPVNAFSYNNYLKSITIPSHVNILSNSHTNTMFENCIALEYAQIDSPITTLPMAFFGGCRNLYKVILPETLQAFGNLVFADCINLNTIILRNPFPPTNYTVIPQTIEKIYVPTGSLATYQASMPEYADKFIEGE